jgi:hypothetical protein
MGNGECASQRASPGKELRFSFFFGGDIDGRWDVGKA